MNNNKKLDKFISLVLLKASLCCCMYVILMCHLSTLQDKQYEDD